MVPAGSHKASPTSRYSGYFYQCNSYAYETITLYGVSFQILQLKITYHVEVLQPRFCLNRNGLGSSLFARHYLGNHYCFLFLQVLRCFSSLGLLHYGSLTLVSGVYLFGNLRIKDYLHLPEAYRSLSRPSSPSRTKASSMRP